MFALPTFALAEEIGSGSNEPTETPETPAREVGFVVEKFNEYVVEKNKGYYIEMGKEFKLNPTWETDGKIDEETGEPRKIIHELASDSAAVQEIFPGINYNVVPEDDFYINNEYHKFDIVYKPGEGAAEDEVDKEQKGVYESQRITLPSATHFKAADDYEFVGWLVPVTYDGHIVKDEPLLYRAGGQFAMPYLTARDDKGEKVPLEITAVWREKTEESEEIDESIYAYPLNDVLCLEYCTPSDDPKNDHWTRVKADSSISLNASGFWMFRFVVIDGYADGTESEKINDNDAVITPYNTDEFREARLRDGVYHWEEFTLTRYAVDTSSPEIALSSSMKNKMEDGLTVGTTYSISTSLTITDSSNTSVTYKVYRQTASNGAKKGDDASWVLIYDSSLASDERVVEGFESYISTSGTINPQTNDVTAEGLYRYKIVYSVKDANGFFGIADAELDENGTKDESGEFHPTLYLGVNPSAQSKKTKQAMEIWKIILFVIAGLSAIGIVVLLLIKPKQEVAGDSRVSGADVTADAGAVDTSTDDTDDTK